MNKLELSNELARRTFLSRKESSIVVEELFSIILNELKKEEDVNIVGFGKFYLYEHAPRPVRNPKTQEEMVLDSYKSLRFKTSSVVKKLLKELTNSEEQS